MAGSDGDRARGFTVTESGIVVIGKVDDALQFQQPAAPYITGAIRSNVSESWNRES